MYDKREQENRNTQMERRRTVLVEADKVEDLKESYPNYFGDVGYFIDNLSLVTNGQYPKEYNMPPKYLPPKIQETTLDPRWLRRSPFKKIW
ncbi:MAG: hypothetical protein HOH04_14040 [Rhodospirillaceae bacterium]|nr:hypothetical protein [Rhodospirillaceae bacterium]